MVYLILETNLKFCLKTNSNKFKDITNNGGKKMNNNEHENGTMKHTLKTIAGIGSIGIIGGALAVGYLAGLLCAKKPGSEFKEDVENEISGLMENGKKVYQTLKSNTEKISHKIKNGEFNNNVSQTVGV